ncbi:rod shape-determining protein [Candidatus Saccharibacteria bacterium QS_5_54_17]|nr:MAG: rod shape-determining protein [Candidatus Saccharibacteria bacterium QS_5_54_17]
MFAKRIAIDLGTVSTLVYTPRRGIIVNEPSVVAVNSDQGSLVAIGQEAEDMLGRTPQALISHRPLRDGVIADFRITREMLKHYINLAIGRLRLVKPDVMISIPAGATSTEKKAVIDATIAAGARAAYIIEEPVAAALGAAVPVTQPRGNMVIDIGGGTTEIAVISLGGVVAQTSVRVGGNKIDTAISEYLRKHHNLSIGEHMAETVKHKIGRAIADDQQHSMQVQGRDIVGGLPKTITLADSEIIEPIQDILEQIVRNVRSVLEDTQPELVSDIIDQGIVLTGGGGKLTGVDVLFKKVIDVPILVADDPEYCVVNGAAVALGNLAEYQKSLLSSG